MKKFFVVDGHYYMHQSGDYDEVEIEYAIVRADTNEEACDIFDAQECIGRDYYSAADAYEVTVDIPDELLRSLENSKIVSVPVQYYEWAQDIIFA